MTDSNFNTSSGNSEPETESPDFSIPKLFSLKPKQKGRDKNYTQD